jgi:hypothetical protein
MQYHFCDRRIRKWKQRRCGLEVSSNVDFEHTQLAFLAFMGYSADFMPHIGPVPDKPGQFIIAGFNYHGMPQILLSSKDLAAMVRDEVTFERTRVPRLFKTTKERIQRRDSPLGDSLRQLWGEHTKSKL